MGSVLIAVTILGGLGIVFGLGLAAAAKAFHVHTDPRVDAVYEELPHIDCGACGYPGCQGYAEAVVLHGAPPNGCKPGGPEAAEKIAALMGLAVEAAVREVAVLKCHGRDVACRQDYAGIRTCGAALLLQNGPKACEYGCLGFGDCAEACPVGAIVMEDDWPRVLEDVCIACGACVRTCPKRLYELRPVDKHVHVYCASRDKGAVVRKVCKVGCIACGRCEKACPVDAIHVADNLAAIDYAKCRNCGECVKACPTHAIEDLRAARGVAVEQAEECVAAES